MRLAEALEADGSIRVLRDRNDILPAEDWGERLLALVLRADAFVICLSPDAVESPEVNKEITSALEANKRVVPVVLRDIADVPVRPEVRRLNYVFLRDADPRADGIAAVRRAVHTDIGWVREHTRLAELAQRWADERRRRSDLLRGAALEGAERWLAARPRGAPEPTSLQVQYIGESRRAATRRLRLLVASAAAVAAVSLGLTALASWQRHEAVTQRTAARAGRLLAEAQAVLADPLAPGANAVQNLLISLALRPRDETRTALARGSNRLEPTPLGVLPWPAGAGKALRDVQFSPDGRRLLVLTDRAIAVWSCTRAQLEWWRPATIGEARARAVFGGDGRHALVLVRDGGVDDGRMRVLLVDLATGAVTQPDYGRVHDAAAQGDALTVLAEDGGPRAIAAVDAVSRDRRWRTTLQAPVARARLVARASAAATALGFLAPEPIPGVIAIGTDGAIRLWHFDAPAGPARPVMLPRGARVLEVGETGGVASLRLPDGRGSVIDLAAGRELWKGSLPNGAAVEFTGGDRFAVVPGNGGPQIINLLGGPSVQVEDGRRTDWDMAAMGRIERYTPVVDVRASDDGTFVATASKDGRVQVWRSGFGLHFGMPGPTFDAVAQFDHGETLGATVTWVAPPVLAISPGGRFVASQSMGLKTNPVGGLTAAAPKLRIWDVRTGGEIARFLRQAPTSIVFAPRGDLAATLTATRQGAAADGPPPLLELWRLTPPQPAMQRQSDVLPLGTPASAASASASAVARPGDAAMALQPPTPFLASRSQRVWLGLDRKLHVVDGPPRPRLTTLDDLAPAVARYQASRNALAAEWMAATGTGRMPDMFGWVSGYAAGAPVESPLPLFPLAVSGDGRRAVLKIGPRLQIYALDTRSLLHDIDSGDEFSFVDPTGLLAPTSLALSRNGRYVVSTRVGRAAAREFVRAAAAADAGRPNGTMARELKREFVVFDLERPKAPAAVVHADIRIDGQPMPSLGSSSMAARALAVSDDGTLLAVETPSLVTAPDRPPSAEARVEVVETQTGRTRLRTPPEPLPSPLDLAQGAARLPSVAAFSPSGRWLVLDSTGPSCPTLPGNGVVVYLFAQPSPCPDQTTRLVLWNVADASPGGTLRYERVPVLALAPSMAVTMLGPSVAPGASLSVDEDKTVQRDLVEWGTSPSRDRAPALAITRERVVLQQPDALAAIACLRLPRALRALADADWARRLQGEVRRPICPGQEEARPGS